MTRDEQKRCYHEYRQLAERAEFRCSVENRSLTVRVERHADVLMVAGGAFVESVGLGTGCEGDKRDR